MTRPHKNLPNSAPANIPEVTEHEIELLTGKHTDNGKPTTIFHAVRHYWQHNKQVGLQESVQAFKAALAKRAEKIGNKG